MTLITKTKKYSNEEMVESLAESEYSTPGRRRVAGIACQQTPGEGVPQVFSAEEESGGVVAHATSRIKISTKF